MTPVVTDQLGGEGAPGDGGVDPVGALHDVEVGEHLPARVEHDAGADTDRTLVVDLGVEANDGRFDLVCGGDRVYGGRYGGVRRGNQCQDSRKRDQQCRQRVTDEDLAHAPILPDVGSFNPRAARIGWSAVRRHHMLTRM
jgi:hypothetical protein